MGKVKDLIGKRYGQLVVLERLAATDDYGSRLWRCVCDCGQERIKSTALLGTGRVNSCGCLVAKNNRARATHGKTHIPEYWVWAAMRQRCSNPTDRYYASYGGRGIKVCERWAEFENFLADMGRRPSSKHTIDRINNDGNYEPENCRWATQLEQAQNTTRTHWITHNGRTQSLSSWAKEVGLPYAALKIRLRKGWPLETALTHPLRITRRTNLKELSGRAGGLLIQ